jgi:hypothetical protein
MAYYYNAKFTMNSVDILKCFFALTGYSFSSELSRFFTKNYYDSFMLLYKILTKQ